MKKIYLMLFLAGATLISSAQSKIDLVGQGLLKQQSFIEKLGEDALLKTDKTDAPSIQPFDTNTERIVVLVDLEKDADIAELEATGAVIRSQMDNLALIEVDYDKVVEFSNLKTIKTLSIPRKASVKMDQARSKTGVNTVHRPLGQLPQAYKGAGVVTGLVDAGITVNHPNFRNSDGTYRVKEAWTITGKNGLTTAYDTEYKLSQFTTDLSTMSHGTHVAGIMSGSYKNLADTVNYYGVATESDIVMVGLGNDAYDNNILMGIEKVIDYAERNNQPCVVNLSMGSGYGPHDGTELFSQYLNKLAEKAVICVAAGNEASDGIAITKICTEADKNINTFVMPLATNGHTGTLEVWSNTNQTFKATLVLYDLTTKEIVYKLPTISESTNGMYQYIASGQYAEAGDITSPEFDKAYSNGYIGFGSKVDQYNNRFTVNMQYYLLLNSATNPKGNIALGLMVEGNAEQRLDVYCTSGGYSTLASNGIPGWTDGGGDGSITDASCAEGVISVGSFTTKDYVPVRIKNAGYNFKNYVTLDSISDFSSYATLVDGRKLPHLAAPGCVVVSSMSSNYMTLAFQQGVYQYGEFMLVAKTMYEGKPYYYDYMMGTSMATPFASGVAALMLQANPDLTCKEVREILMETATRDTYVTTSSNAVQWGAGKIDALKAVKKAIELGDVTSIEQDAQQSVVVNAIAKKQFEVTYIGAIAVKASLYSVSGQAVVSASAQGDNVVVDATNVASGVYVLAVESNNTKYTTKVVVK